MADEPAPVPSQSLGELFVGGIVLAVLSFAVIGGLIWAVGWFADSGYPRFSECKAKTKAMLLDPASASFGAPYTAVSLDDKRLVRYRYNVSATNGFGGRIERLFVCLVDDRGPERNVSVY